MDALALGVITQKDSAKGFTAHFNFRYRRADRKFFPVCAQGVKNSPAPHAPFFRTGMNELINARAMRAALPDRDQRIELLTQHFSVLAAKHALGSMIEQDDFLRAIDHDNRVHGRIDHGIEHRLLLHMAAFSFSTTQVGFAQQFGDAQGNDAKQDQVSHCHNDFSEFRTDPAEFFGFNTKPAQQKRGKYGQREQITCNHSARSFTDHHRKQTALWTPNQDAKIDDDETDCGMYCQR